MLDFEEIYVIDSKTKSITRAKVLVKNCLLILSLVAFGIFSAVCCNYLSSKVIFLSLEFRLPLLFNCLTISLLMLDMDCIHGSAPLLKLNVLAYSSRILVKIL